MANGYTIANFVPLYIFVPLIFFGLLELVRTPNPTRSHQDARR